MAIGTPVQIAATSAATASGSPAAVVTTVQADINDLIVFYGGPSSSNNTLTGCTDSAGHTYAIVQNNAAVNLQDRTFTWVRATATMAIGTAFTATTSSGNWNFKGIWKVSGVMGLDTSANNVVAATSTGTSQSTGTMRAATDHIVWGASGYTQSGLTYTESAGFTNLFGAGASSNGGLGYEIVSPGSSVTWAPSWTSNASPVGWELVSFAGFPPAGWEQQGALLIPALTKKAIGGSPR